jgi:hypothetical protein
MLLLIIIALLIVWALGSYHIWGFEGYRTLAMIFLALVVTVRVAFRTRVRPR